MALNSSSPNKLAPENWVVNIKNMLKKDAVETPVCIQKVPRVLRDIKPDVYTPQLIGLGPYHHWREELYEMELCKLVAVKKLAQKGNKEHDHKAAVQGLEHLVNRLKEDNIGQIRACYDTNLDVDDHTLTWMMAVDGIFLLQFLQAFLNRDHSCLAYCKRTLNLIDPNQSSYHLIIKDIMMLENQIPIFVLQDILPFPSDIVADEDHLLLRMLTAICRELSPLKNRIPETTNYSHLLELLYYMILPGTESSQECLLDDNGKETTQGQENTRKNCFPNVDISSTASFDMVGKLNIHLLNTKPFKVIGTITGQVVPSVKSLLSFNRRGKGDSELGGDQNSSSNSQGTTKAPKIEEITIPSVSKLLDVGIQFVPKWDGLVTCVEFDKKARKLKLPVVRMDGNTEVIMSNLVAYEAEAIRGPLVLARYTEFMNGIIDTPEDVRLLRERKIIDSYLKSDQIVADIWNRMSRSTRMSHVPDIDKTIKEVNEYYDTKKRVMVSRFTKGCMFCTWKILMLLLLFVLVVLMIAQSFCSVYQCPRLLQPDAATGS